jgi:phage shock protein C
MGKLYRSRRDKKITGLCGGLAETLNIDATLLRLLVVVTTFFSGGTVILLYFIASIVIPKEPGLYPPHDPFSGSYGHDSYSSGWNPHKSYGDKGSSYGSGNSTGSSSSRSYESAKTNHIDEMMKDIEKKALQKEIDELRAKVAQYEKNNDNNKGDV